MAGDVTEVTFTLDLKQALKSKQVLMSRKYEW
jgi:hypothetical protein